MFKLHKEDNHSYLEIEISHNYAYFTEVTVNLILSLHNTSCTCAKPLQPFRVRCPKIILFSNPVFHVEFREYELTNCFFFQSVMLVISFLTLNIFSMNSLQMNQPLWSLAVSSMISDILSSAAIRIARSALTFTSFEMIQDKDSWRETSYQDSHNWFYNCRKLRIPSGIFQQEYSC